MTRPLEGFPIQVESPRLLHPHRCRTLPIPRSLLIYVVYRLHQLPRPGPLMSQPLRGQRSPSTPREPFLVPLPTARKPFPPRPFSSDTRHLPCQATIFAKFVNWTLKMMLPIICINWRVRLTSPVPSVVRTSRAKGVSNVMVSRQVPNET